MTDSLLSTQLHLILDSVEEGVYGLDLNGNTTFANRAACELTGWSHDEIIGQNNHQLVHYKRMDGRHFPVAECPIYAALTTGMKMCAEHDVFWHKDNRPIDVEFVSSPLVEKGKVTGAVVVFRDITEKLKKDKELECYRNELEKLVEQKTQELRLANDKLSELANTDWLTGLANRSLMEETLETEIARVTRNNQPLSVLFCDIDHFKAYNDHWGHDEGDNCLKQVAQAISSVFKRKMELVARYGGEEFAVILPDTGAEKLASDAIRLHTYINELQLPHGAPSAGEYVTISIGGAVLAPGVKMSPRDLLIEADKRLYDAKGAGRNCYRC